MIFNEKFKVQLKDIGKENHIKNIGILEILENIATHHSDVAGYGPNSISETGVSWVLLDWKLRVLKRPKYGQILNVNTWARTIDGEIKRTYTYRDFEIYDEENNLCIIGTSKWVLVDISVGKITKISSDVIEKYNLENKNVFDIPELDKIKIPDKYDREMIYKVYRKDIDLNGHMHNLYYLSLAYEVLPEEVYKKRPFNDVRIQYKNEIKVDEIIKCKYTFENGEHIISILNSDETKVHAIIILK